MTLQEVIDFLKTQNQENYIRWGFAKPHSYRGYYEFLAFEPIACVKISEMLAAAESAVGNTYTGWKGGEYTMSSKTPVYLAFTGCLSNDDYQMTREFLTEICSYVV